MTTLLLLSLPAAIRIQICLVTVDLPCADAAAARLLISDANNKNIQQNHFIDWETTRVWFANEATAFVQVRHSEVSAAQSQQPQRNIHQARCTLEAPQQVRKVVASLSSAPRRHPPSATAFLPAGILLWSACLCTSVSGTLVSGFFRNQTSRGSHRWSASSHPSPGPLCLWANNAGFFESVACFTS